MVILTFVAALFVAQQNEIRELNAARRAKEQKWQKANSQPYTEATQKQFN